MFSLSFSIPSCHWVCPFMQDPVLLHLSSLDLASRGKGRVSYQSMHGPATSLLPSAVTESHLHPLLVSFHFSGWFSSLGNELSRTSTNKTGRNLRPLSATACLLLAVGEVITYCCIPTLLYKQVPFSSLIELSLEVSPECSFFFPPRTKQHSSHIYFFNPTTC